MQGVKDSISFTSVCGELSETIIKNRLTKHLEDHNMILPNQDGFCKGKSRLTNLLEFFESINKM